MSSIGLFSKGLILILWSELVLEGFQSVFKFIKGFSAISKHDFTSMNPTSVEKFPLRSSIDEERAAIQQSDCFFTRVLFFPDQDSISSLLYKVNGDTRALVTARETSSFNTEKKDTSHPSTVAERNTNLLHHLNDPSTSKSLEQNERCRTDGTTNTLAGNLVGGRPPIKTRGALEEMVLCLDGAVTSIDVCVLLLTCDRLTAPLLRAKARGVRVRVLLDRSMAAVEGSSLPLLRKNRIPVRLLPSDNNNRDEIMTSNAASQNTRHTGGAAPRHKLESNHGYYNGSECNKRADTTAVSSSGLMHHKFAVIDAWKKSAQKTDKLGHVANKNTIYVRNESRNGCDPQFDERAGIEGMTTGIKESKDKKHEASPYQEGAALVITGSFNWTRAAVTNNNENIIISNRPELVAPFSEQFEQLWREAW